MFHKMRAVAVKTHEGKVVVKPQQKHIHKGILNVKVFHV